MGGRTFILTPVWKLTKDVDINVFTSALSCGHLSMNDSSPIFPLPTNSEYAINLSVDCDWWALAIGPYFISRADHLGSIS